MEVCEYTVDRLVALLPLPADDANKYTRGKLTAVAGSARYPGAACLAAAAGQRMGAGYTEVVTDAAAVDLVRAFRPSLVVRPWNGWQPPDSAVPRPGRPCAYLVGPGFDADDDASAQLAFRVLKRAAAPVAVDGGALAALATKKGQRLLRRRFILGWPTVVTPHGGEAARLARALGLPADDPARLARLIALAYGATAVLKGPDTFVSDGDRTVLVAEGSSALAKAGTGDVLAGMVGALLAQGLDSLDAGVLAAALHARAGRIAAARLTPICVVAEDVLESLPDAIAALAAEACS